MLSELHSLNLKLFSKQYDKKFVLHLIVAPQLCSGWRHNYSTKTRQAGRANEQSMYSLMSMPPSLLIYASKAGAYLSGTPYGSASQGQALGIANNIRLGWRRSKHYNFFLSITHTLKLPKIQKYQSQGLAVPESRYLQYKQRCRYKMALKQHFVVEINGSLN